MNNLIEKLSDVLLDHEDSAIIAESEILLDVAEELRDLGYWVEETDFDYEDEFALLLSRIGDYFILESPFNDECELLDIESKLIFVQDGVLEQDELDRLDCETLVVFGCEEECCCGGQCGECDCCDDEEVEDDACADLCELLEEYSYEVLEANGCEKCTKEALLDFAMELLKRFRLVEK